MIHSHYNYPGEELISINPADESIVDKASKFVEKNGLTFLASRILSQKLFGIESNFIEENMDKVRLYRGGDYVDYSREVKLLANDKAGKSGRATWFVIDRSEIPMSQNLIDEWQVAVSSANAGGQKRDNQICIIDNHSCFGRSRVALGTFKTEIEASHFLKYLTSYIVRFLFLMTDEALNSLGKRVPDLLDYTDSCGLVDFKEDIDQQLMILMGLTEAEYKYLVEVVSKIRIK